MIISVYCIYYVHNEIQFQNLLIEDNIIFKSFPRYKTSFIWMQVVKSEFLLLKYAEKTPLLNTTEAANLINLYILLDNYQIVFKTWDFDKD